MGMRQQSKSDIAKPHGEIERSSQPQEEFTEQKDIPSRSMQTGTGDPPENSSPKGRKPAGDQHLPKGHVFEPGVEG